MAKSFSHNSHEPVAAINTSEEVNKAAIKDPKIKDIQIQKESQVLPASHEQLTEITNRISMEAAAKKAAALTDEQIGLLETWELTKQEHFRHPKAATVPKHSILCVDPATYSVESLSRYGRKDLIALAQVIGANKSGSKTKLIEGILKVWSLRKRLSAETVESLSKLSKKDIDGLLDQAGCGKYGSRKVKATTLLNWKNQLRDDGKRLISNQNHIIRVRRSMEAGQYHQAILSGRMSFERAVAIIESASLTVPEDLATPQNYQPVPKKVKAKQLLLPFMLE